MEEDIAITMLKNHDQIPDSHLLYFKQWTRIKALLITAFIMTVSTIELIAKTTSQCLHVAAHPNGKVCFSHSPLSSLCSEGRFVHSQGTEGSSLKPQLAIQEEMMKSSIFHTWKQRPTVPICLTHICLSRAFVTGSQNQDLLIQEFFS